MVKSCAYSRRKCICRNQKSKCENKNVIEWSEKCIEARIARDQAKLAEIRRKKHAKTPARVPASVRVMSQSMSQ